MLLICLLIVQIWGSNTTKPLTVHLVPHSHTDIGWQSTLESYFYAVKLRSFQPNFVGVHNVITTIIDGLVAEPERRFSWSEMKYFQMWWRE